MLRLLVISLDSQAIRAQPPLEQGLPRSATPGCRSTPTYQKAWRVLRQIGMNRTLRIRVGPKLHGILRASVEAITNTIQNCRLILEGSSVLRELFQYSNRRRSNQTNQSLRQKQTQARLNPSPFPASHANHSSRTSISGSPQCSTVSTTKKSHPHRSSRRQYQNPHLILIPHISPPPQSRLRLRF